MTRTPAHHLKFGTVVALAGIGAFAGVALAANTVDPDPAGSSSLTVLQAIYAAFAGGHYAYCAALGVMLMVALTKRYLGDSIPWLHTDAGGATLALVGADATALAAGLASGGALTLGLAESALLVGIGAAGGYHVLEKLLVEPWLKPLQTKLPSWAQPILNLVLWVFNKPATNPPTTPLANPPAAQ